LSIHPGGFLLGHKPVHDLVPVENATMPGRTVIQWDKYDVEALGLFKIDLLGLGALNQLHIAFDLLRMHHGITMTLADIPREDPATFTMLCRADSVGVFQIESRAQMNMLPRLRPRCYYDLVIEVAIVRPGPISGGMVHPYIARRHGKEPISYPHPSLEAVLEKTLGVPLFQEQVMRLAMVAADYSPGEADQLRRDMATWRRHGPIESHRDRLIARMTAKGIAREFAERIFAQIRGFGEYGFPESHAASFALIAYATAWLKCHHHVEFSCALLNAQPMGFYAPATIVEDARRHDVAVHPIDVTRSDGDCTLEEIARDISTASANGKRPLAIRMGLRYVKGLSRQDSEAIVTARREKPFASIADLARRSSLAIDALQVLAEAGALATLEPDRRRALWTIHGLSRHDRPEQLLLPLVDRDRVPQLAPLGSLEQINWDYRTSSHSTHGHPLAPLRRELRSRGLPTARTVNGLPDGTLADFAGIVICRQRPHTAGDVTFMTLEDETGFVNLVLWSSVFERQRTLAKTLSFMGVSGRIQAEAGVVHLIVNRIWRPRLTRAPAGRGSRDFH
jgi:error-prone DNA polymerase